MFWAMHPPSVVHLYVVSFGRFSAVLSGVWAATRVDKKEPAKTKVVRAIITRNGLSLMRTVVNIVKNAAGKRHPASYEMGKMHRLCCRS